jgi:uncharacterized protein
MPNPAKTKPIRGLILFFAFLCAGAAWLALDNAQLGNALGRHLVPLYMWSVAGASLAARLFMREGWGDVSFGWTGWPTVRAMLIATLVPVAVELFDYAIGSWSGLVRFAPSSLPETSFGVSIAGSPTAQLWKYALVNLTLGSLSSCKSAAGEEIGWRGYMLTRLRNSGIPVPILVSGLIWFAWHLPLILGGHYSSIPRNIFSISMFAADLAGLAYIFAWLRLSSGSIWPCIWAHGVWNVVFVSSSFWSVQSGGMWIGEAGPLTALAVMVLAIALYCVFPLKTDADENRTGPSNF